ncbi:MAG: transglutaminase-like domain-containing protein [Bacteroidales bacterium]|jgi:hypothetical protein|nr:transglutaminase-like domain-containing protein [Bacteroidales bacterium]
MKTIRYFILVLFAVSTVSCSERHFISDTEYRSTVDSLFNVRKQLFGTSDAFAFTENSLLTSEEYEAMQFLYAFMPLSDMADYDNGFFLQNVRLAFTARREMTWGKDIPEDIFRHFVLPVRVNNENLDTSRSVFYRELKPRIEHLSLHDAALEINHWCHEKVAYAPSDSRTSSPLATVRSAIGRCGEESTFAVAAMRAAGIPARQVYTPRWAHTDDNHAWIEVWVDGKWHYMGACEPEPVLDLGWFSAPAKRTMLLHTKVFGKYDAQDEVIAQTPCYTEINVTENYAPIKTVQIKVVDTQGKTVENATVDFGLYNYAEFYPIVSKTTNADGIATLTSGLGDLVVWVRKDNLYGFRQLKVSKQSELTLVIDRQSGDTGSFDYTLTPPSELPLTTKISDEQRQKNEERLQTENAIRQQYESGFYTKEKAMTLAKELKMDAEKVWLYLEASRGNYAEIEKFLRNVTPEQRYLALMLLDVISQKDLRDAPADILLHHLQFAEVYSKDFADSVFFARYVLNPRVANEMLSSYRNLFTTDEALRQKLRQNPEEALTFFRSYGTVNDALNPQRIPLSVKGFAFLKTGDAHSAGIAAVGFLRSLGIAARREPATSKWQYFFNGQWNDFSPEGKTVAVSQPQGKLLLDFTPDPTMKTPQYEVHYTLAKFANGKFTTLNTADDGTIFGEKDLVNKAFDLDTGYYLLTTGRRMADGSVLSHLEFFTVKEHKTLRVPLIIHSANEQVQVIGNINPEATMVLQTGLKPTTILQTTGRGYFVLALLEAKKEPVNHALHDIAAVASEFEKWGRPMVFLFPNKTELNTFDANEFKTLPQNIIFGIDEQAVVYNMLKTSMDLSARNLPIFVIADSFGRVVFISQGYRIGLGEQLLNVVKKL